jgi:L-alanine-DL-glutamate epimerase-like enolase superfamily enzyme
MRITEIECHVLLAPNYNPAFTSSAQDSFVVIVRTDQGIFGVGESDVNPWIAKMCIEARGTHTMSLCARDLLIGADPLEIEALWKRIYIGTAMHGRRGAFIHALGAVEMALWDIKGKALGKPVHALLGNAPRDKVIPYASLQPNGGSFEAYRDSLVDWANRAKQLGFRAVKAEVTMNGPYAHAGLHESYDRHTEVIAAVRKILGPEIALMVDVQYMWADAETALRTVRDWAEFNLFFLETPIWIDNLDEIARLSDEAPMPIAFGEWQATRHEFADLMDRGKIGFAQPDVGRVGGLIEAKAVCDMAKTRGIRIVPHCWKTGISISATAHLAFITPHCPFIEFLPPELSEDILRRELVSQELRLDDGAISLPQTPGLGIELNWDALRHFAA